MPPIGGMKRKVSGIEPAAEADDLPQHRPDGELLEDDRLGPPVAEVAEPPRPGSSARSRSERPDDEDDQLEDVEEVDDVGVPKPLSAQSWASGLIRVRCGFAFHSSTSNGGGAV